MDSFKSKFVEFAAARIALPEAANGPYVYSDNDGRATVTGVNGAVLSIDTNTLKDGFGRIDKGRLALGIAIWLDDEWIGDLVQVERGLTAASRALHIRPADGVDVLPEHHYFRHRLGQAISLESPRGTLLRRRSETRALKKWELAKNETDNAALVALYIVVSVELVAPMLINTPWQRKRK